MMAGCISCLATPPAPSVTGATASPSRETDPEACPLLEFVADRGTFRPVQAPGVSLAYFEVPTTGFSANGAMYSFVWTNHRDLFKPDAQGVPIFSDPVGHAALLRSDDGGASFRLVWDRLGDKLVYLAAAVVNSADVPGLPDRPGRGLLIWGSGKMYRRSNPYLAYMPLAQVENKQSVRYFAGVDTVTGRPRWGTEAQAVPLFDDPCLGELSVTWNRNLRQWLMMYNCGRPHGGVVDHRLVVVARLADTPGGLGRRRPIFLFPPRIQARATSSTAPVAVRRAIHTARTMASRETSMRPSLSHATRREAWVARRSTSCCRPGTPTRSS
jgi:hypothetical protein